MSSGGDAGIDFATMRGRDFHGPIAGQFRPARIAVARIPGGGNTDTRCGNLAGLIEGSIYVRVTVVQKNVPHASAGRA